METGGLGAGLNPTPPENKEKTVEGTIVVEYPFSLSVLENLSREEIIEEIKSNLHELTENGKLVDVDF